MRVLKFRRPNSLRSEQGFALIMTLLLLSAITMLAVMIFSTNNTELQTARSYSDAFRSDPAAEIALQHATEKIKAVLRDTADSSTDGSESVGGINFSNWAYFKRPSTVFTSPTTSRPNDDAYYTAITKGQPEFFNAAAAPYADYSDWLSKNTTWLFSGDDPDNLGSVSSLATGGVVLEGGAGGTIDLAGKPGSVARDWGQGVDQIGPLDVDPAELGDTASGHSRSHIITTDTARADIESNDAGNSYAHFPIEHSFHTTVHSRGEDRIQLVSSSGGVLNPTMPNHSDRLIPYRGMSKMNLNANYHIGAGSIPDTVDRRVDNIADWIEYGAPDFFLNGAVNYSSATGTLPLVDRQAQIKTIAASVIDYLDADHIPTQPALADPSLSGSGDSTTGAVKFFKAIGTPAFFGAESNIFLNEVMVIWNCDGLNDNYTTQTQLNVVDNGDGTYAYNIPVTYRFELVNPSSVAVTNNVVIRGYDLWQIQAAAFINSASGVSVAPTPIPNITEVEFDLGSITIPPADTMVVDFVLGDSLSGSPYGPNNSANINTHKTVGSNNITNWSQIANANGSPAASFLGSHATTTFLLYEKPSKEWLSHSNYLIQTAPGGTGFVVLGPGNAGASLGNRINDPRAQPMRFFYGSGSQAPIQIPGSGSGSNNDPHWYGQLPGSLGSMNTRQNLNYWIDRNSGALLDDVSSDEAITHVANAPFKSVGELGNIYDPGWTSADPTAYGSGVTSPFRGGGSLRVGSSDGKNKYTDNSWVLIDLFGTSTGMGAEYLSPDWEGRVNINFPKELPSTHTSTTTGVLPTATNLEAAFRVDSLSYTPPSGTSMNYDERYIFHKMRERLSNGGADGWSDFGSPVTIGNWRQARPLFFLGEFSELDMLKEPITYASSEVRHTSNNLDQLDRSDAGREELFARSANLLTTKSNSYRVYCVGEYGIEVGGTFIPKSATLTETSIHFDTVFNENNGDLTGVNVERVFHIKR